MPRSPISQVTWCADSGDSVQKSRYMSLSRRPLFARRFCERMNRWNFSGSRTKKTGVLNRARQRPGHPHDVSVGAGSDLQVHPVPVMLARVERLVGGHPVDRD